MTTASRRDVAVIAPWYPTNQVPFGGSFVASMVDAVAPGCDHIDIMHVDPWGGRYGTGEDKRVWEAHKRLLPKAVHKTTTTAGHGLLYVPVPVKVGTTFATAARRSAEALSIALAGKKLDAPIVHAHVGLRGGYTALENAGPDAKVFITEHASFLSSVLEQPDSRAMYDEVLGRATGFFAVGDSLRDLIVSTFPQHAAKVALMPNPIDFDLPRSEPVTELRRWLFIGNLIPRKRVDLLLEAFALCREQDPTLELTFVGGGALMQPLKKRASDLGIADAVAFPGPATPEEALAALRRHDLLVHPSRKETFGMTIVEAIAADMPVLATRSGGPEHTLAGFEDDAGELIDVEERAESIVEGYWRLRSRFPQGVHLARAKRELADRYGYAAVGRAHLEAWYPGEPIPESMRPVSIGVRR